MLDHQSTTQLWDLIMEHWTNQTVVIVEHKVNYIWNYVDRVIVMNENGEITHDSTPQDILDHHTDILNEYGVWHPNSWRYAPKLTKQTTEHNPLLNIEQLDVLWLQKLFSIDELTISSGEWLTITGPNGTGKTTF